MEVTNLSQKPVAIPAKYCLGMVHRADIMSRPWTRELEPSPLENDDECAGFAAMAVFDESDDELCDGPPRPKTGSDSDSAPTESSDQGFVDQFVRSSSSDLTSAQVDQVKDLLARWKHVFSLHSLDLGCTDLAKHHIQLKDPEPFRERYRRVPPSMVEDVRKHLQEMLDLGVIRRSNSPFASNVVLAKKKDNSLRFCIDLRALNARTVRDAYSLPRIDETLDSLQGASWFSTLDLKSGYWQVEMAEEDKAKTAFSVGPLGFYECNRMPFGLTNAPATFQRCMETCMGDLYLTHCLVYIDDVIVFSRTFEEHLQRLEAVFRKLHEAGLKLKPSKCCFLQRSIKFLGHQVSAEGVSPDPDKLADVKAWPVPTNVSEVQRFLGFVGFYRRFQANFSKIARPLHDLVQAAGAHGLKKRQVRKLPFQWGSAQQGAFEKLKELCTTAPVLAFADYSKPFVLHTDASLDGLGAVLYQEFDGKKKPIAYASRRLSNAERNYPVHKLEFLALRWSILDKFHDYLFGHKFTVFTDNNPLTYVLSSAKLDATGHRWVAQLANYDFSIHYRSGRKNIDADALSRIDWSKSEVSRDVVSAVLDAAGVETGAAEAVCLSAQVQAVPGLDDDIPEDTPVRDWAQVQRQDPVLESVIRVVESSSSDVGSVGPDARALLRDRSRLGLKDRVLYRVRKDEDGEDSFQLVLPKQCRGEFLASCHDDMGHLGRDRTLAVLRDRVFWHGMARDVGDYIAQCKRCLCRKASVHQRAPLVNIETSQPLELLCVDFLKLEPSKGGVENILVITDHFSRYAQAFPTKNQTARTTARIIYDHFVVHYGAPARLHSDQGRNFTSSVIRHLCELLGISKSRTTPYHPMGNGQCERFNSTLLSMLGTLDNSQKSDWKSYVPSLVHAYNCTRSDATGFSPYYIMFGRHPRLPVDLLLGRPVQGGNSQEYGEYVRSLKRRLEHAYQVASEKVAEVQRTHKERYDLRTRGATVEVGDSVLIRNVGLKGTHKIADKWQDPVYRVLRQPNPEIPVFVVRRDDGEGPEKTLHRNMLLPLSSVPPADLVQPVVPDRRKQNKKGKVDKVSKVSDSPDSGTSSSEEEEEQLGFRPVPAPRPPRVQRPAEVQPVQAEEDVPVVAELPAGDSDASLSGESVISIGSGLFADESVHSDGDSDDADLVQQDSASSTEGEDVELLPEAVGGVPDEDVEPLQAADPPQPEADDDDDDDDEESPQPQPRRSTRQRRPPDKFDPSAYDFVQHAYSVHSLSQHNQKLTDEVHTLKDALRILLR